MTSALPRNAGALLISSTISTSRVPSSRCSGSRLNQRSVAMCYSCAQGGDDIAGLGDDRGGRDSNPEREQQRYGEARGFAEVHIAHRRGLICLVEQQLARES